MRSQNLEQKDIKISTSTETLEMKDFVSSQQT